MRTALLVLLSLAVSANAAFHLCRCGLFTTGQTTAYIVYELPGIDVPNCDYVWTCKGRCIDEFNEMAAGGNLYATHPTGNGTIGQALCDTIPWPIDQSTIYLYSEICNGPWRYTGEHSMQMLCCDKDGQQYICT
ncbi:uncharacterized protein LOC143034135 [Oratosquilla oratoria]|uniref:uncharacterized protein LOC143034135 n=1 Tax=Oratosquilla oratoria TaxID=337810 RepID=UPI003F7756F8